MNNRADVPTILLFLMGLSLVIISIGAFVNFNVNTEKISDEIFSTQIGAKIAKNLVETDAQIILNQSVNCNREVNQDLCSKDLNSRIQYFTNFRLKQTSKFLMETNFYNKLFEKDYLIVESVSGVSFEMNDVFVSYNSGKNSVRKNFDISLNV